MSIVTNIYYKLTCGIIDQFSSALGLTFWGGGGGWVGGSCARYVVNIQSKAEYEPGMAFK